MEHARPPSELNLEGGPSAGLMRGGNGDSNSFCLQKHRVCILINYERRHLKDSIVKINDTYFNIDSAPHNMPQKGLIGDLQIDKHDKKILFYDSNIDCSVDSCTVKCIVSEPAIDRLISTSPYKVDIEHIELLKSIMKDG
ncbi:hypothetical protein ACJJTC_001475 [Scirpophaga incertulas]